MEEKRDLEGKTLLRDYSVLLESRNLNEEERTLEFPFSSETPVNRGYLGDEILVHREDTIDFSRLNASAPLLFNHNPDIVLGVVQRGYLDKKKKRGMAKVRFAKNAAGEEAFEMVKDGIYRNVSFGYSVNETEEAENGSYRVTNFTPAEISLVSTPADFTVGVGRSIAETANIATQAEEQPIIEKESEQSRSVSASDDAPKVQTTPQPEMTDTPDLSVVRSEAAKKAASEERSRIASITALTAKHGFEDLGRQLVENGSTLDRAREAVLDQIQQKPTPTVNPVDVTQEKNVKYSIGAGIRAVMTGDWSSKEAGFAREISQEVALSGVKKTSDRSFFVPYSEIFKTRATYVTSGATTGGNLVATDLLADEFIYSFDNAVKAVGLGIQTMSGLTGDVAIPRQSGKSTVYWLSSETTAITQSESTFDQVTLSPKNAAVLSKYSRQTLLQATPGIDDFIRNDLSQRIAVGVDAGIINGSGSSGQMTGILNQSGVGSVAGGTNGAAITIEHLVNLEKEVLIDNAGGDSMAYLTNAKVLADLKLLRAGGSAAGNGSFLWNTDAGRIGRGGTPGIINGYAMDVSNNVPSNLTKGSSSGVCSAVIFGNFSSGILGVWGNGLEIEMGLESDDFAKALQSVRAITTVDFALRQPTSFAVMKDVTH